MQGRPTGFWGKLASGEHGRVVAWHPLECHCADVGACSKVILENTLLGARLARIAGRETLDQIQLDRLAFLAAVHDVGKFNIGFQNKALDRETMTAGHVAPVVALFDNSGDEQMRFMRAVQIDRLTTWGPDEAVPLLLLASFSHHGSPVIPGGSHVAPGVDPRLWNPARGLDPFAGMASLVEAALRWFPSAAAEGGASLPSCPEFQHVFCGLVTLADWLASDERFFWFSDRLDTDRFSWACTRARVAVQTIGLDASVPRFLLGRAPVGFDHVCEHPPRGAQSALLELPLPISGSLTILEAETGSGKTEAALARYLRLFQEGHVDGVYFALPTRTSATQMYRQGSRRPEEPEQRQSQAWQDRARRKGLAALRPDPEEPRSSAHPVRRAAEHQHGWRTGDGLVGSALTAPGA